MSECTNEFLNVYLQMEHKQIEKSNKQNMR